VADKLCSLEYDGVISPDLAGLSAPKSRSIVRLPTASPRSKRAIWSCVAASRFGLTSAALSLTTGAGRVEATWKLSPPMPATSPPWSAVEPGSKQTLWMRIMLLPDSPNGP